MGGLEEGGEVGGHALGLDEGLPFVQGDALLADEHLLRAGDADHLNPNRIVLEEDGPLMGYLREQGAADDAASPRGIR